MTLNLKRHETQNTAIHEWGTEPGSYIFSLLNSSLGQILSFFFYKFISINPGLQACPRSPGQRGTRPGFEPRTSRSVSRKYGLMPLTRGSAVVIGELENKERLQTLLKRNPEP